jgi:hypothetical protein
VTALRRVYRHSEPASAAHYGQDRWLTVHKSWWLTLSGSRRSRVATSPLESLSDRLGSHPRI